MAQNTVYHYTSFPEAAKIRGLLVEPNQGPGLEPKRTIARMTADNSIIKASFALLEPEPPTWKESQYCPGVWNVLKQYLRARDHTAVLMEISVDTDEDTALVADRAHMEGNVRLNAFENTLPAEFHHRDHDEAAVAFFHSAVPLTEYLHGETQHLLPEVLIYSHIPADRVRVSEQQPLLEQDLGFSMMRDQIVERITRGWIRQELMPWRSAYETQHGSIETSGHGKERF